MKKFLCFAAGIALQLSGCNLETESERSTYESSTVVSNSSIYGVGGSLNTMLKIDSGYVVNAELAEKYGFDVDNSVLEQLDILKKVKENEKECVVFSLYSAMDPSCFVHTKTVGSSVYWDGETHSAKCVHDNPEYMEVPEYFYNMNTDGVFP